LYICATSLYRENTPLGKILTDNLLPGMILGADVRDRSGRLLLGTGTELSERHLFILRTWGVIDVEIAGAEEGGDDSNSAKIVDPDLWAAIEKKIAPLFSHSDDSHPAIKELMRLRIMREASDGKR
jgi:hypothetical protein